MAILVGPHGGDYVNDRLLTGGAVIRRGSHFTIGSSPPSCGVPQPNIAGGDFTVSMLCRVDTGATFDNASFGVLWCTRNPGSTGNSECSLFVNSSGNLSYRDLGGTEGALSGAAWTSNVWKQITMRRLGSAVTVMGDTSQITSATLGGTTGNAFDLSLGGAAGDNSFSIVGLSVAMFYVATRYVGNGDLGQLVDDPYCMLRS